MTSPLESFALNLRQDAILLTKGLRFFTKVQCVARFSALQNFLAECEDLQKLLLGLHFGHFLLIEYANAAGMCSSEPSELTASSLEDDSDNRAGLIGGIVHCPFSTIEEKVGGRPDETPRVDRKPLTLALIATYGWNR